MANADRVNLSIERAVQETGLVTQTPSEPSAQGSDLDTPALPVWTPQQREFIK